MDAELRQTGTEMLVAIEGRIREQVGDDLAESSEIIHISVTPSLVEESQSAAMVVLPRQNAAMVLL